MTLLSLALNEDQVKCEFKSWICLISSDKECHPIKDQTNSFKYFGHTRQFEKARSNFLMKYLLSATLFSRKWMTLQGIYTTLQGPKDLEFKIV